MPSAEPSSPFVRTLLPAFEQAAAIALALEGRVANRPKEGESREAKAALTLADTAAQEALLVPLLSEFRAVQLEAEEDTPSVLLFRGSSDRRIVVDPIDGTFNYFLKRRGPYAVMAGLAEAGRYRAALVALPREGLLFWGESGGGFGTCEIDSAPRVRWNVADGVFVSDTAPEPVLAALHAQGFAVQLASGGAISVAPLVPGFVAGLRFAPRPAARVTPTSVSVRGRIGLLIAREAGVAVTRADGLPFPEAIDAPAESLLVARDPAVAQRILLALKATAS